MSELELQEIGGGGKRLENPENPSAICFRLGKHIENRIGNLIRCARCQTVLYKEKKGKENAHN